VLRTRRSCHVVIAVLPDCRGKVTAHNLALGSASKHVVTYFCRYNGAEWPRLGQWHYLISTTTSRWVKKSTTSHTQKLNTFLSQNQLTFHRKSHVIFGLFSGVWCLTADVSEHCICSIFMGYIISTRPWRWNRHSVPKRRLLNTTRRGTTQKITRDI
jgi:hypothetical protein